MDYKQVILLRTDLKLPKGKLGAQVAHAAVESSLRADKSIVQAWRNQGMKKIVLKVETQEELYRYNEAAKQNGLPTAIITDAGRTVVEPGTVTCLGIGPAPEQDIDKVTASLKML